MILLTGSAIPDILTISGGAGEVLGSSATLRRSVQRLFATLQLDVRGSSARGHMNLRYGRSDAAPTGYARKQRTQRVSHARDSSLDKATPTLRSPTNDYCQ